MSNVQSFVHSNCKRYLHRFVCGCVFPFFYLNCTNVIIIRCSRLFCLFSFSFVRLLGIVFFRFNFSMQSVGLFVTFHCDSYHFYKTHYSSLFRGWFREEYICACSYLSSSTNIHPSILSQKIALASCGTQSISG